MKNFKLDKVKIALVCCMLFSFIFFSFFFNQKHKAKESFNVSDYRGAIILGRQFDYDSKQAGAELITFRRDDIVWTESFINSVFQLYVVGDTIK